MSYALKTNCLRYGTAAVEFAVVLPLIVLMLLGSVEVGRGVMVTHSLQEAAQAGCRVYGVEDTTIADALAIVDEVMSRAGVTNHTVAFDPPSKAQIDVHMEPVTVTVSIPYVDVAWLAPEFLNGATLQGKCIMPADLDVSDGGDSNGYSSTNDDNTADGYLRDGDDDD